jgi:hypothetical protein
MSAVEVTEEVLTSLKEGLLAEKTHWSRLDKRYLKEAMLHRYGDTRIDYPMLADKQIDGLFSIVFSPFFLQVQSVFTFLRFSHPQIPAGHTRRCKEGSKDDTRNISVARGEWNRHNVSERHASVGGPHGLKLLLPRFTDSSWITHPAEIEHHFKQGKNYLRGTDKQGRPLIYTRVRGFFDRFRRGLRCGLRCVGARFFGGGKNLPDALKKKKKTQKNKKTPL